jgi:hypothetical protein
MPSNENGAYESIFYPTVSRKLVWRLYLNGGSCIKKLLLCEVMTSLAAIRSNKLWFSMLYIIPLFLVLLSVIIT